MRWWRGFTCSHCPRRPLAKASLRVGCIFSTHRRAQPRDGSGRPVTPRPQAEAFHGLSWLDVASMLLPDSGRHLPRGTAGPFLSLRAGTGEANPNPVTCRGAVYAGAAGALDFRRDLQSSCFPSSHTSIWETEAPDVLTAGLRRGEGAPVRTDNFGQSLPLGETQV